eukprot:UN17339
MLLKPRTIVKLRIVYFLLFLIRADFRTGRAAWCASEYD